MDSSELTGKGKSLRARGKEILRAPFKLNRKDLMLGRGSNSTTPEFLTRSLDPAWIDIEMMGYWLQKCDSEHGEQCRRPFGMPSSSFGRPSLLIDVRRKCLVKAQSSHRYACLSYVWGGASTLKTEKQTLDDFMEDHSLGDRRDRIPRTIRDTIDLVDQLGIPYLWVDSLCIIQDDNQSKHDQILAMAGIYANAYVTIIAGNGWDADHGLRGIQGVTEPRQLSPFLKSDIQGNLQPHTSVWYSRGWTFQEMLFSPRKIMLQYQLAIWECDSASWHETSLSRTQDLFHLSTLPDPVSHISPWKSKMNLAAWPNVKQYIHLVQDYTRRKLTYGDDALPAITSLLSIMCSSFKGGFVSGLPEMFFHEALLWQPEEPMQRRSASSEASPSWSWSGWEGQIMAEAWEKHFVHLHYYGKWLEESGRQGMQARQVTAPVEWFYGITLQDRFPIKPAGWMYIRDASVDDVPIPPRWSVERHDQPHLDDPYLLDEDLESAVQFPLPIVDGEASRVVPARYLFCRTRRAYLKRDTIQIDETSELGKFGLPHLVTFLQDSAGVRVGSLNLNLVPEEPDHFTRTSRQYELVSISAGSALTIRESVFLAIGYYSADRFPLGWGNFARATIPNPEIVEFYYVLWIEWKDGIAQRKGLGRVLKEAWDREATEVIDLVLG